MSTFRDLILSIVVVFAVVFSINGKASSESTQIEIHTDSLYQIYRHAQSLYHVGKYNQAISVYDSLAVFCETAESWTLFCHSLIGKARCYRKLGEMAQTTHYLKSAHDHISFLNGADQRLYIDWLYTCSLVYSDQGEYQKSFDSLHKTLGINKKYINDDSLSSLIFNAFGINYIRIGNQDSALYWYHEAAKLKKSYIKEPDNELAVYYNNIASIYNRKYDFRLADIYALKALNILMHLDDVNPNVISTTYATLGNINYLQGLYDKALSFYDSAEMILSSKMGDAYFKLHDIFQDKASVYYTMGNLPLAEEYYNKAIRLVNMSDANEKITSSSIHYILGLIYFKQKNFVKAKDIFKECIAINEKHYPYLLANSFHALARCFQEEGNIDQADLYYRKAILNRISYYGESHPSIAYDYVNYGVFISHLGDTAKGFDYLNKAKKLYFQAFGQKHPDLANIYNQLGRLSNEHVDFEKALGFYQQAIITVCDSFTNIDPHINPEIDDVIYDIKALTALKGKAEVLYKLYLLSKTDTSLLIAAYNTYLLVSDLLFNMRSASFLDENINLLAAYEREINSRGLTASLELFKLTKNQNYLDKALDFSARSKSAILYSSLQEAEAKITGGIPEQYRTNSTLFKQKIAGYKKLINDEIQKADADSGKLAYLKDELFDLRLDHEKMIKIIETEYPAYFALKFKEPETSVAQIRNKIGSNEVLIDFIYGEGHITALGISKTDFSCHVFEVDTVFEDHLKKILDALYKSHPIDHRQSKMENFINSSCYLYEQLIGPFEDLIMDKNIRIIPDEQLNYLPFEILLSRKPEDTVRYYQLDYLIKSNAICYDYSYSLVGRQSGKTFVSPSIVAFFPNDDSGTNDNSTNVLDMDAMNPQASLKFSSIEKEFLSNVSGSRIFSSGSSSKDRFVSEMSRANILHLSSHGIIDPTNSLYSKLVFSKTGDTSQLNFLHTYEIYNYNAQAALTVLNVCNSGYGVYLSGEGIISLARAFFYGGCNSLIATLWPVNDESGAEIVIDFYNYLLAGKNKSEALQLAKIAYLESADAYHSHPHFWSAHILIGEPGKIVDKKNNLFFYLITVIVLLLNVIFIRKLIRRT